MLWTLCTSKFCFAQQSTRCRLYSTYLPPALLLMFNSNDYGARRGAAPGGKPLLAHTGAHKGCRFAGWVNPAMKKTTWCLRLLLLTALPLRQPETVLFVNFWPRLLPRPPSVHRGFSVMAESNNTLFINTRLVARPRRAYAVRVLQILGRALLVPHYRLRAT